MRLRSTLQLACLSVATLASVATSAPRGYRSYPAWRPGRINHEVGRSVVSVWVARTGREGMGIVVKVRPTGEASSAAGVPVVDGASTVLELGRRRLRPDRVVVGGPSPGARARAYLVFRFDGLETWNVGERRARLRLGFRVDGAPRSLVVELAEERLSAHGSRSSR